MNVLIVDDDPIAHLIIEQNLRIAQLKAETHRAENGLQAWEKIEAGLEPDVILLDLNMPVMNGFELMEKFQEEGKGFSTFIITSSNLEEDKARCDQYPFVSGYFQKPFGRGHAENLKAFLS